jgi:hypothetical protein
MQTHTATFGNLFFPSLKSLNIHLGKRISFYLTTGTVRRSEENSIIVTSS